MSTTPSTDLTGTQGPLHGTAMTIEPGTAAASEVTSNTAVTDGDEHISEVEHSTRSGATQTRTEDQAEIKSKLISEHEHQSAEQRETLIEMSTLFLDNGGTFAAFSTVSRILKKWPRKDGPNVELAVWRNKLAEQLCGRSAGPGYPTFLHDSRDLLKGSGVSEDELRNGNGVWMRESGLEQDSGTETAPIGHVLTGLWGPRKQGESSSTATSWNARLSG